MAASINTLGFVFAVISIPSSLIVFYNIYVWLSPRSRCKALHDRLEYARTLIEICHEQDEQLFTLRERLEQYVSFVDFILDEVLIKRLASSQITDEHSLFKD